MLVANTRITAIDAPPDMTVWRELLAESNAPVFYRPEFLAAYRSYPLRPVHDSRHLLLTDTQGKALAALPVYLVDFVDPFRTMTASETLGPGSAPACMVISHMWHCYDGRLLTARPDLAVVEASLEALRAQAAQWHAGTWGFVNVARHEWLGRCLDHLGITPIPARERYRLQLGPVASVGDYVAGLPPRVRHEARRCLRRAEDAGVTVRVDSPPLDAGLLSRVAELLSYTAERHNPGYYPPHLTAPFLRAVGPTLRIISLWRSGRAIAAGICFHEGRVFHGWALGVDPEERAQARYSPFLVLLVATVETALASRCVTVELGRTNGEWKQRHGARPVELTSWLVGDGK
jgi:predicted N-acyltransferase